MPKCICVERETDREGVCRQPLPLSLLVWAGLCVSISFRVCL